MDLRSISSDNPTIQPGAVALIDALDFRRIWGRGPKKPSLDAFETLKAVRAAVDAEVSKFQMKPALFPRVVRNLVKEPTISVRFLSDTVVIAASVRPRTRAPRKKHEEARRIARITLGSPPSCDGLRQVAASCATAAW
jgi:hypothetical protein